MKGLPNLCARRKAAKLSQQQLADAVGVTRAAISLVEICNNDPSLPVVLRIVAILRQHGVKTSVEELAGADR